ncbi:MAG: hypothetical protein F6K47_14535 [Symploca sp. SIO2E6]|nr:hypothetical protein [Symploca sp. SIO2E6]
MAYWIKITYERNKYVVDLDRISAFACAPNGKVTFWLPDSAIPIILTRHSNSQDYQQVWNFIQKLATHSLLGSWIRIFYERNEYFIDLNRISSFCHYPSGKLVFWLPDSSIPIIINSYNNFDSYHKILNYIQRKTGHILS